MVKFSAEFVARFWLSSEVDAVTGCRNWGLSRGRGGYGQVGFEGKKYKAHRVAYELVVGPIPAGMLMDHLCRNRGCVNPQHLEPVTPRENVVRGISLAGLNSHKTHCQSGHPFDEDNTYFARGQRSCRACGAAKARARKLSRTFRPEPAAVLRLLPQQDGRCDV